MEQGVTVVIPSYRRPALLRGCVESILKGTARPNEIVVIGREGDGETRQMLAELRAELPSGMSLKDGWVREPGHIPPVEAGVRIASGEIVAILDDDVTVTPEWLASLLPHFSNPAVGVVGGRVITPGSVPTRLKGRPGQISWYGRLWGNVGSVEGTQAFEVATVMEGNCAWRRALLAELRFDPVLNFDDASMYGLDLCFQARAKRCRVLYEPQALVYHHAAARPPELNRADRPRRAFTYCRNYTYIMLRHLPLWRKPIFLLWWFLIGEGGAAGLLALAGRFLGNGLRWPPEAGAIFRGKLEGLRLGRQRSTPSDHAA